MRVRVDDERCKGHGVCVGLCPDVFDMTDDGYAVVSLEQVSQAHAEAVRTAVEQCPEGAISIAE